MESFTPPASRAFTQMSGLLLAALLLWLAVPGRAADQPTQARAILIRAVLSEDADEQIEMVRQLAATTDPAVQPGLAAWRLGSLYLHAADGAKIPFLLEAAVDGEGRAKGLRLDDGQPLLGADGKPLLFSQSDLTPVDTSSKLRKAIKTALDLFTVGDPNPKVRRDAITKLGQNRNPEFVPFFEARLKIEQESEVRQALSEAIALTRTVSDDAAVRVAAIQELGEMRSINALALLQDLQKEINAAPDQYDAATVTATRRAIKQIDFYIQKGNLVGTAFRGLSLSAVLLVVALGLAITFGLMGVINMAHGEIMMVGAYTAYVCQNIFRSWFGAAGFGFDCYFIVALAVSFIVAGLVGLVLERGIIRFLYKRPLESLLATWGVSLLLQQVFRHIFGAANVQVSSPSWMSGSYVVQDVLFAYNRLFVIGFAVFIVIGTWLLLTRTSLGLQIRAVMQNRAMASCVGVRTDRVNMMTFAFGSGLAGMAGACLAQIGNVGPSLGQNYIVDCFMIVVLGGVGNLVGTVMASLGVGITDQILQPWLGAVMGKITVLAAIILFLQWRPSGLFATRSRNLEG
jgi:urea transport system permease protein